MNLCLIDFHKNDVKIVLGKPFYSTFRAFYISNREFIKSLGLSEQSLYHDGVGGCKQRDRRFPQI